MSIPARLSSSILDAVLPHDCFLCATTSGRTAVCEHCLRSLPRLDQARCPVCAITTPGGCICGSCLHDPPAYDATIALYEYDFPADALVRALKYRGQLGLASWMAGQLAATGRVEADVLVPLPLHPRRLMERGFNQSLEIARSLARRWGIPFAPTAGERILDGAPQARLAWAERRANVKGAFRCSGDLTGKHVAVVDDVMTTGATLNEFARALKRAGAARVTNCVIARTLPA